MDGSRTLLNDHNQGTASAIGKSDSELWDAKRLVDSAVNHSTGEVVPKIARMCAFIPASLPITLGMLTMTSTPSVLLLQWVNQSYNALFNFSHRSSGGSGKDQVLKAYALATATSCGLALGLKKLASNIRPPWLISTIAVMAAGSANVAFTRSSELTNGVDVYDKGGQTLGMSTRAGQYAVGFTILSRSIFLPIPIMVLPGYMSQWIRGRRRSPASKGVKLGIDIGCIILSQAVALPICIAAFPQKLQLRRSQLEPKFYNESNKNEIVFFQKGI